jgi:hypothetical protein
MPARLALLFPLVQPQRGRPNASRPRAPRWLRRPDPRSATRPQQETAIRLQARKAYAVAKVAGPAVVAVVALLISGLSYWHQRAADANTVAALLDQIAIGNRQVDVGQEQVIDGQRDAELAVTASQSQYADRLAFWVDVGRGVRPPVLVVQNLGAAPVTNVVLTLAPAKPGDHQPETFKLGIIPPCTVSSTTMTRGQEGVFAIGTPQQLTYSFQSWAVFTDAAGQAWRRDGDGALSKLVSVLPLPAEVDQHSTFKAAAGCS